MRKNIGLFLVFAVIFFVSSCKKEVSNTTGWNYGDSNFGGFQSSPGYEQETGPGLIFIEGGNFVMGRMEQDVFYDWNNTPRRVTVSSFYMDEHEIRNLDYREYLYWLSHVYTENYRFMYRKALPDTLVWRERLAYNEPLVESYLRHPAYEQYPVVGVSWKQASEYCEWRTDRVNELILVREGIIDKYRAPEPIANNKFFNLESYLFGGIEGIDLSALNSDQSGKSNGPDGKIKNLYVAPDQLRQGRKARNANIEDGRRYVNIEDGIFLPRYRLPTEAEWEFAALAYVGNQTKERLYARKIYPWNGHYIRNDSKSRDRGQMMANSMRGRGDAMGLAGALNDAHDITGPVKSFWPNDNGLYDMAGNVNEWVMDVYRDLTFEDMEEFRPFRGNIFEEYQSWYDPEEGTMNLTPEAANHYEFTGKILKKPISNEAAFNRENYTTADNRNYLDGDLESLIPFPPSESFYFDGNEPITFENNDIPDNAIFDTNNMPQINGAKYIDEDRILLPNGVIAVLSTKSYLFPNGHNVAADGTITLPDGSIVSPNGNITIEDFTIFPDQIFKSKTGEMYKDGKHQTGKYDYNNPKSNRGGAPNDHNSIASLVNDRTRVFKGGSWKDRAYWLSPGSRRYLDENTSRADLGFRCAMDRIGTQQRGRK